MDFNPNLFLTHNDWQSFGKISRQMKKKAHKKSNKQIMTKINIHARTHAHTHARAHRHTLSLSLTHTLSLSLSLSLTHTHTHSLNISVSHTHARTHARTHIHTHTTAQGQQQQNKTSNNEQKKIFFTKPVNTSSFNVPLIAMVMGTGQCMKRSAVFEEKGEQTR